MNARWHIKRSLCVMDTLSTAVFIARRMASSGPCSSANSGANDAPPNSSNCLRVTLPKSENRMQPSVLIVIHTSYSR